MSVRTLHTDKAPAAIGPYSQGVIANGLLFTAGQIPLDPDTGELIAGDVVAQTRQVLANLEAIIQTAGSTWQDVVKTTVFLQDMADFPRINEVYAEVFGSARPARSTVQVSALPRGVAIEIDAVVVVRNA